MTCSPKGSRTPFLDDSSLLLLLSIPCLEAQQPRVAFVTSFMTGTADLGSWPEAGSALGASAGDEICRTLATAATLQNANSFVAVVVDEHRRRLLQTSRIHWQEVGELWPRPASWSVAGPWVRADGLPFGESIDRLLAVHFRLLSARSRRERRSSSARVFTDHRA